MKKFIFIASFGLVTVAYDKTIDLVIDSAELAGNVKAIMRDIERITEG